MRIDQAPLFRALHALAIDNGGGWAGFALSQPAAFNIKRVVDAIERAIVGPAAEIIVHRAARGGKSFGSAAHWQPVLVRSAKAGTGCAGADGAKR
jgi:hypothetical protein